MASIHSGVRVQRHQVGLGEVAVVVRLLLGAQRVGAAVVLVPVAGLLDDPFSRASIRSTWRRASYSMARPSDRSELRFLISQRVPSSASPRRGPRRWRRPACEPSSILASDAPMATRMARSSVT